MKKQLSFLLAAGLAFSISTTTFAHVANEHTIFEDMEFSDAKEEVTMLRGLNVISHEHGVSLFKPLEKLTKQELATWSAGFKGEEAVATEEGFATKGDVLNAYFGDAVTVEDADVELTHEEFAYLMDTYLTNAVNGKTLYDMAGMKKGPSGVVENVTALTEGEGDAAYEVFSFKIDGKDYQLSGHPKVVGGPVELYAWMGKELSESWMSTHDGVEVIDIAVAKLGSFQEVPETTPVKEGGEDIKSENPADEKKAFPIIPIAGGVILLGVIGWLFTRKKK